MTPKEIIKTAIEYRTYYNTYDARIVAEKLGIKVSLSSMNPSLAKAYIIKCPGHLPIIAINSLFSDVSQNVLCAHELGHAILHKSNYNEFATTTDSVKQKMEYEANLFAVAFLCDEDDFNIPFIKMSNYVLKSVLDYNIKLA